MSALPAWDLTDLYASTSAPEVEADFRTLDSQADALRAALHEKIAEVDGDTLATGIADYEAIQDRIHKLMAYAYLHEWLEIKMQYEPRIGANNHDLP